jgi:hypothetical protein
MIPAKIEGDAIRLGAPRDWSDAEYGKCGALWVRIDSVDGLPFMRSAWELEADEAGLLLAGAKVQLGICGTTHPVVQLGLGPLPEDFIPPLTVQQAVSPEGVKSVKVVMFVPGGQRITAAATLGTDGLGPAVALAIGEIEKLALAEGLL